MQYHSGALSMLAYEMDSETVRTFKKTPAFSRSGEHNPVWISDTAFVFAALPDGDLPATTSVRARTGKALGSMQTFACHLTRGGLLVWQYRNRDQPIPIDCLTANRAVTSW